VSGEIEICGSRLNMEKRLSILNLQSPGAERKIKILFWAAICALFFSQALAAEKPYMLPEDPLKGRELF
jgi:hypothetical protein